ncbi:MAG: hypothetical protein AB7I30_23720, partial [Isosphaeraceae bacterium]
TDAGARDSVFAPTVNAGSSANIANRDFLDSRENAEKARFFKGFLSISRRQPAPPELSAQSDRVWSSRGFVTIQE